MKRLKNRSGMTLIESLFAVMLTVMLCAAIWGVSSFVDRLKKQDAIRIEINDSARAAMEKILWGYQPANDANGQRDGVREAASYQILGAGSRLSFTDALGAVREVRLNGVNIEYTEPGLAPQWAILYSPPAGADAVTTLVFKNSPASADVVVAELVIGRRVQDRWFYASIQTKVFVRN